MTSPPKYISPKPPIPKPLRGAEIGTFAHDTVVERIPDIGRRLIAENDFSTKVRAKLEALIGEIPNGRIWPLNDGPAPDLGAWACYIEPYSGQNWLEVPWFFAEVYFYRRVLEEMGYFQPGPGQAMDPFVAQKRRVLVADREVIQAAASHVNQLLKRKEDNQQVELADLLQMNLWSNQADLSMWDVEDASKPSRREDQQWGAHILVDDSDKVSRFLVGEMDKPKRIDFIMDNAGLELVNDLAIADYLLETGIADSVRFHLKPHPTFVSDAMIKDVRETIAILSADSDPEVKSFGDRLENQSRTARLQLVDDLFWTSPLPAWEMPLALRRELSAADLIISKGDANYRRFLGDRHWPFTTPFAEVLRYVPAPLVALRVCKAEVVVGLEPGQPDELDRIDPDWKVNGEWGVIQYVKP